MLSLQHRSGIRYIRVKIEFVVESLRSQLSSLPQLKSRTAGLKACAYFLRSYLFATSHQPPAVRIRANPIISGLVYYNLARGGLFLFPESFSTS